MREMKEIEENEEKKELGPEGDGPDYREGRPPGL
jgi:hypothetical protein